MKKEKCCYCGKEVSSNNLVKHLLSHEEYRRNHPEYYYECKFCGRTFYRKESFVAHEKRCKENPNRINFNTGWSKGLTAESDERVWKNAEMRKTFYKTHPYPFSGKTHTEESKQKISKKLIGNHNNNLNTGGYGKKGCYKGIFCASSYELAFVIYCLDHNIPIKRCSTHYTYCYNEKTHQYYPDFEIDGTIIEIKGYWKEVVDIKANSVTDKPIKILYRDDLKDVFDYIEQTYGKTVDVNIQDLYET